MCFEGVVLEGGVLFRFFLTELSKSVQLHVWQNLHVGSSEDPVMFGSWICTNVL